MLAGVGLMMVCCSSLSSFMMMGDDTKKKEDDSDSDADDADADDSGADDSGADADYTESCDDLGGGIIVRHESGKDLGVCKTDCSDDLDCLGFIHGEEVGFCQLHDNKDPYGVDICDKGLKVYRK